MLLEITIPIQQKGDIDVEVQTIIISSVVSAYQLDDEYNDCRWNLNPKFLTCFNFDNDFSKITLWRSMSSKFWLEVEIAKEYEQDDKRNKIPNMGYTRCEMLEVSAVKEVKDFPSIER